MSGIISSHIVKKIENLDEGKVELFCKWSEHHGSDMFGRFFVEIAERIKKMKDEKKIPDLTMEDCYEEGELNDEVYLMYKK